MGLSTLGYVAAGLAGACAVMTVVFVSRLWERMLFRWLAFATILLTVAAVQGGADGSWLLLLPASAVLLLWSEAHTAKQWA